MHVSELQNIEIIHLLSTQYLLLFLLHSDSLNIGVQLRLACLRERESERETREREGEVGCNNHNRGARYSGISM